MRKLLSIVVMLIACITTLMAQNRTVTGVVTSAEDGQPVIGASVVVTGSSSGTVTDIDGKFSISVPKNAKTLRISYISMVPQDVPVKDQMSVILQPDSKVLQDVVVTALGISKEKKTLGYAVQDIKADALNQASQLNVANALQGKVSGVQITQAGGAVGASQRILIRGNSSFNSNDPLIVVDGVPMDGGATSEKYDGTGRGTLDTGSGLNDINPDDIENISVLKGGSAALYGMRAGNGVILITTKKGNNKDGKMKVSYDGSFTVDKVYHLPELQDKYGQGWGGSEYDYKTWGKDYYDSYADFALNEGYCYVDGAGSGVNDGDDESWGPRLDIGLQLPQYNSPIVNGERQATPWVSHPNNIKDFFQTGYSQSHNLSIENSSSKGNFRFAMGYRDQKGTVPNTDQTRINAMMSGTYNYNKYVSVDAMMQYSNTHSDNLMLTGYSAGNPLQSVLEWFGRQVDMNDLKNNWQKKDADGNYYNWITAFHVNPYFNMHNNTNTFDRDRFIGKASLWLKPTDYLKFEGRIGYDYYTDDTFQKTLYHTDCPNGWFGETGETQHELNLDLIGYFNKQFGDFTVDVLAGANYRDLKWKYNYMGANSSYGLTIPGLYTMGNVVGSPVTDIDNSHIRSNSVFANAAIGWKSQVFVEGSMRNDWSSTIKDSFFYPSISLSWIPTATFEAMKSDVLSYLKVRANIAKVGNATSAYRTRYYMTPESSTINGAVQYRRDNTLLNPDLKPESILSKEVGIEAAFWKNRIRLDFALYDKTTTDQIMTVQVPVSSGYGYKLINAGKVVNRGMELSINADIIRTKDFQWTSTLNWSKDRSTIKSLTDGVDKYTIASDWSCYNYAAVGESWGSLYGVGFDLDEKGRVQVDEDGMPLLTASSVKIGDVTPGWLAGWSNEFTYKDYSFGFLLDYRKGGDFFSVTQMFGSETGILGFTAAGDLRENGVIVGKNVLTDRTVVKAGTDEPNDIVVNAYDYFESYYTNKQLDICDGSYLKLREIHFTWNLPKRWLAKTKVLNSAKLSVIGSNVAILWLSSRNQAKIDPESTLGSGNSSVGFESNSCPPTRSWGVKLNLTF